MLIGSTLLSYLLHKLVWSIQISCNISYDCLGTRSDLPNTICNEVSKNAYRESAT